MIIEFQGATRTVTGSMHVVHVGDRRILLDCGLFQGRRAESNERNRNFPFDPASIDAVVLSHAHIDHSGNLPNLVRQGYAGPIFSTLATRDLCRVMLVDSGHIQEKDAEYLNKKVAKHREEPVEPLYTAADGERSIGQFRGYPYGEEFAVLPNVTASFTDAGHILGSASIRLTVKENGTSKILGFTGDVGRWGMPIIRDPMFMGNVEALISESTYGGVTHDPPEDMGRQLAADISRVFARHGKIIVPAFSVGRTQDLVYALHTLFDSGKLPRIPIYVDSPLAINATEIFKQHPECFDDDIFQHIRANHDPFGLSQLKYVRSAEDSKALNDLKDPCIIISASGMCEAGRILHHLANNIGDPRNAVLIVGYQAEHTLGRRLVDEVAEVSILGTVYERRAEVIVHNSFSAHADGTELLKYAGMFDRNKLHSVFLVHGEYDRQLDFRKGLLGRGVTNIEIPVRGDRYTL